MSKLDIIGDNSFTKPTGIMKNSQRCGENWPRPLTQSFFHA